MKGSLRIGSIAGIGIFIHWTFAILIAYIIFSNYRQGQNVTQILWSVLFVLSIFVTVFLHELGHALAAKRYKITTKDITLLPIGGLARLESIPEKPMEELVVAIAGPAVNIALALVTGLFLSFPNAEDLLVHLTGGVNSDNFFLSFFIVNIWLALFNLIPAFPMDGGRVLRALLSFKLPRHTATTVAARIGQILAIGFVFLGFYTNPFLIFIGLFIILGAQSEAEATKAGFMLKGGIVRDVAMKNFERVDAGDSIESAIAKLLNGSNKNFLVYSNNQPVGTLSRDEIIKALNSKGKSTTIESVMNKELVSLDASLPLEKVYQQTLSNSSRLMLVFDKSEFIGVLDFENMLEYIMVKGALGKK